MDSIEKEILSGLKRGDEQAYKYLFDHHYELLCQIALSYVQDDFIAETIVGDIIFHIWEIREVLDIQQSLRAYLIRAVRFRSLNYLKLSYMVYEKKVGDNTELLTMYAEPGIPYPLGTLLEKELADKIETSISGMSCECRRVFEMSRFEDMKYQQIADELDISVNTVKYHMKHALSILHRDLSKYLALISLYLTL